MKGDIYVTPEKSAEMSRPRIDPKAKPRVDPKAKPGLPATPGSTQAAPAADAARAPVLDDGADIKPAEAATISREASGIAGDEAQSAELAQ